MRRGFTLVELTVALLVIAIVTRLAVREVSVLRDRNLVKAADRQLEEIRAASLAFIADMGRMVSVTNGTLSELWTKPADVPEYRVVSADPENVNKILVPTGWRGPYLRLPIGKTRLMDPWGNAIEPEVTAVLPRVGVTNSQFAVSVSHYGAKSAAQDCRTVSLLPDRGVECSLDVKVVPVAGALPAGAEITYKWYGPASGVVTGEVKTVASGEYARFRGLTPGRRIVYDSVTQQAREVMVESGANLLEIKAVVE